MWMAASARWWAASPNRRRPAEAPVSRLNPRDPGRRRWLLAGLGWWAAGDVLAAEPPVLMLAHTFRPDTPLAGFFVSEKLDGVRARWDGQRLLNRGGEVIAAPAWFTAGWPEQSLDGELWMGRGRFEDTVSTVRSLQTDRAGWPGVHFMVFDAPDHPGPFRDRLEALRERVARIAQPWVQAVPQEPATTHAALMQRLHRTVNAGGEGLMLHHGDAHYRAARSDQLLKLKLHDDAEARVVAHLPGQGRHAGRLGALLVETPEGRRFRLGSGFTDAQRESPPPVGSWVTYRYRGWHDSGLPRFATFWRERAAGPGS